MGAKVVIISHQFSVVVKSLEKGLTEQGFDVKLIDHDLDVIKASLATSDAYIMYLQESLLREMKQVKNLFLICDALLDNGRKLMLIGSDNDQVSFYKAVPAFKELPWIQRPVDIVSLSKEIEDEVSRINEARSKKKVLVIDDDPLFASIIMEWLKNDYSVETVSDGMKAITWLVTNKVDLILLDYEMPVVDGPKILEMLRMQKETASIPVIFLTGIANKASISRVVSLKPQGYLLKSTPKEELIKTLNDFFSKN